MRRIKLVLAAVAAMVAMFAVVPGSAMAQDLLNCEFVGYDTYGDELYLCEVDVEEDSSEEEEEDGLFDEEEDGFVDDEEDGFDDE